MSGTVPSGPAGDGADDIFGPLERSGTARGLLLVAGAVVVGALLLPSAARAPLRPATASARARPAAAPTTPAPASAPSTTAPLAVPASSVKVLVANGTNRNGAAAAVTSLLSSKGFATLSPVDALTTVSRTQVYPIGAETTAADEVAGALGLGTSAVQPSSTPVPVTSSAGATVVVVVGPDLAARS